MFNTAQLDQILQDRALHNERVRQDLLQQVLTWLDDHGLRYGIQQAYLFGSLTQPHRFHQHSDIDIAVEQVNSADFFTVIGSIAEAMGRDVDLIALSNCHFAQRIRQTGIQWTATNSSC